MTITFTDLFCGAGGSSLGAEQAGMTLKMAANHWATAIEVHQHHFPHAAHDVADISQADPRRYPRTNVLLASPECTNHSQARGVSRRKQDLNLFDAPDSAAEKSRATMWDVPRFAEQMRYEAVIVENVIDAVKWVMWPAWWQAMELLGYHGTLLSINSQDHGVPQSRDRIYIVWVRNGIEKHLDLQQTRTAHCEPCGSVRAVVQSWKPNRHVGRYRQQWQWSCTECGAICEPEKTPASTIIDWTLPITRIGERKRPLSHNTRMRVFHGLQRHGWVPVTTAGGGNGYETTPGNRSRTLNQPLPTQQTSKTVALVVPPEGLLMRNNSSSGNSGYLSTSVNDPAKTMTTAGHQALLMPYYSKSKCKTVNEPIGTLTTVARYAVLEPDAIVDDCGFRMLEPYEVAAAMAFPKNYIPIDKTVRDQMKLAGNAVTPPVMHWISTQVTQALEAA